MVARYHISMNDATPGRHDKFSAYRARKKAAGLREIRMWVADLRNPEILGQLERDCRALRGSKSEKEALAFIEGAITDDAELYD